jgi:glucose/arabinose dehydrogenase
MLPILLTTVFFISITSTAIAQLQIKQAFTNLSFINPVFLAHAGDSTDRVFVIEQRGMIYVFPNQNDIRSAKVFLDIRSRVNDRFSESGLLGLAFHPEYKSNGKFYVHYNFGSLNSRIAEYRVSSDPDLADANSERSILEFSQPASNHNGGMIAFGPDSLFYIALGDGGGRDDQFQNGQDRTTLLGNILRIDVNHTSGNLEYAIPNDNPFFGNTDGWRTEIWAWGLRNPWRFSFDRESGDLWAADVGQGDWEEIDLIEKGKNYGWNIMEGFHCFRTVNCDMTGLVLPVFEYDHGQGISITGGYVYRGKKIPQLNGTYIYGDYLSRKIWGLRYENGQVASNALLGTNAAQVSSFGEDEAGEVYIVGYDNGKIYRFEDPTTGVSENDKNIPNDRFPSELTLFSAYPNPFNPSTTIRYVLAKPALVDLAVFDAMGRRIKTLVAASQAAGSYSLNWHAINERGEHVSGGIYFIQLTAGGFRKVQKVLLVK